MHYVYILKCSDANLYIGQTADLKKRFERHKNGIKTQGSRCQLLF